jgi:hypothetical protein
MANPFQKYQSEQVQQLAPGFVDAYGKAGASIGQGLAAIGQSVVEGYEKAEATANEEAKQQAVIGTYLKRDPRIQGINKHLAEGDLEKDEDGNVFVPDDRRELFDTVKLDEALAYYNQTGGDGSKLKGAALTKFTTEFEAEKKYEADQAAAAAAGLERRKTEAEINKMNADAAEKYARAGIGSILGAYGSGQDMSTYQPPAISMPSFTGTTSPQPPATAGFSVLTGAPSRPSSTPARPNTVTPTRNAAGLPLAITLSTAPTSPAVQTTPTPAPGGKPYVLPSALTANMPTNIGTDTTSNEYITAIPKLQAARVQLDNDRRKEEAMLDANYRITLNQLTARNAPAEDIKAFEEMTKNRNARMADRHAANVATLESRLKAFESAANEARAAEKAAQGVKAEVRADKAEGRAETAEKRTQTEFDVKYGKEGQPATPGTFPTFAKKIETKINAAGTIPGRTGGSEANKMRRDAQEEHTKIMQDHPAWYDVGMTTEGANQYQFRMVDFPTAAPLSPTVRGNVQAVVEGYAEGRVFLTGLLQAVESSDEDRVRNYLDRFLVTTSKDDLFAEGQALGQFGVAAFRRAIVSGGNFSDADREYVQKLITQINTPNPFANKDFLKAQTKKLASFIDSKFRSTLAANGVRLDLDTSEKFLKREDINGSNSAGLDNLQKAKDYYKAFNISTTKTEKPSRPNEILDVANVRTQIEKAREAGNERLVKVLEQMLKENAEDKAKAAKKAAEAARAARGA